ncbi:(deoxy)nucleoside triphosphate pyrophosphohydrolase [Thermophilibacter mediterraneus]|uniref:(deoxy)nucleoside triphosphate pyrophosphohydrolase n=1 Tax=Thermophilibacter mediterraneus TaxID=1871031 RepID=UPI002352A4CE|nr:(deoxy)nucleoside triphosphate pyrophosphohydrolase [Thermophilibacter mediterraneus]
MSVHVSAGIIHRDGRVLAARRADGERAGLWELPGGKVERGEDAVQALRRELREELGCEVGACWLYDTIEYEYPEFHLTMDCYVCTLAGASEPTAREGVHDELRWLARDELLDVEWLPADLDLARGLTYYWDEAIGDQML